MAHTVMLLILAGVVLAGACDRRDPQPDPGMATEQFVDVMVALRRAAQDVDGADAFAARRQQVLRDAGVTDSMLLRFVRVRGQDLRAMSAIWDSVAARLRDPQVAEDPQ